MSVRACEFTSLSAQRYATFVPLSALICLSERSGERSGLSVCPAKQLVNHPPFIKMRNSFFFFILIVFIVKRSLYHRLYAPVFQLRSCPEFFFFCHSQRRVFFSLMLWDVTTRHTLKGDLMKRPLLLFARMQLEAETDLGLCAATA